MSYRFRLKGYLFFASAQSLLQLVLTTLENQEKMPEYRRIKYIMFDCELLDGMDASAFKTILKIQKNAGECGVKIM